MNVNSVRRFDPLWAKFLSDLNIFTQGGWGWSDMVNMNAMCLKQLQENKKPRENTCGKYPDLQWRLLFAHACFVVKLHFELFFTFDLCQLIRNFGNYTLFMIFFKWELLILQIRAHFTKSPLFQQSNMADSW